jgi:hypothetical protein
MCLGVLTQIEGENSFVEEEVGLLEDVSFLDVEGLGGNDLPHRLFVALGCAFACFFEGREAAVVEAGVSVSQLN